MTLRHRLLLVYGIVVLLSMATVGVAAFELRHAHTIIGELQLWKDFVLKVSKLQAALPVPREMEFNWDNIVLDRPPATSSSPEAISEIDFSSLLASEMRNLSLASEYLDVEQVREAFYRVYHQHDQWIRLPSDQKAAGRERVRAALDDLSHIVDSEVSKLNVEAARQNYRRNVLIGSVFVLTVLHVLVIGSLLRRWLLHPMEQLGRQVEALGRDEPPPEPLLNDPRELSVLAHALDNARQSLGTLRRQLIESERLTTIGQLATQLAHNLRNPLASIRAAAQVNARQSAEDSTVRTRMHEIIASVDRMNQWIAGLMEIARREPTPTRSADVVPLLQHMQTSLRPELTAKELSLALEVPAGGLCCTHDPATLEHALLAMLVNAIEASPLGGRIIVRGEYTGENGAPARTRISVKDQGAGLPPHDPERIFEFSYSTKQRGMGLGLALARQALQRQGGAAHAFNNPDGGATVYVELPIESSVSG